MMKINILRRVAAAVIAVCTLLFVSCEALGEADTAPFEISLRDVTAGKDAGSTFVTVKCAGDWTLSVISPTGKDTDWVTLVKTAGTGNDLFAMSYVANNSGDTRMVNLALDDGRRCEVVTFTQYAEVEAPDEDQTENTEQDMSKLKWLELPKMDDPDLEYHYYTFNMAVEDPQNPGKYVNKNIRNYSIGYSRKHYLSKWVAYPLCKMYTSGQHSGGASDWAANPLVDMIYQADYTYSFGNNPWGYERGHQIANADRKCSSKANKQTYYFTNSTLQHKTFNGAIWGNLEGKLRTAAATADTLYVITGCVVREDAVDPSKTFNINHPEYIADPSGKKVPVPVGYFKAAVRRHKASTVNSWLGAAFYLDHMTYSYSNVTEAEVMSIDDLEEMLGMDLFANLPAMVGESAAATIERQNPWTNAEMRSVWGL